eukprot:scaffold7061_cov354-Pinguiococcus_pyrenoidosus.AAC.2
MATQCGQGTTALVGKGSERASPSRTPATQPCCTEAEADGCGCRRVGGACASAASQPRATQPFVQRHWRQGRSAAAEVQHRARQDELGSALPRRQPAFDQQVRSAGWSSSEWEAALDTEEKLFGIDLREAAEALRCGSQDAW